MSIINNRLYRYYLYDKPHHISGGDFARHPDLLDALEQLRDLADSEQAPYFVEMWEGENFIAHIGADGRLIFHLPTASLAARPIFAFMEAQEGKSIDFAPVVS